MDKSKLLMFIVMLVTICISVFSLSRSYEAEHIAKSAESGVGTTSSFLKIFADVTIGTVPLEVNFSSLLLRSEGTPKYHWEFGDGETSNETNPTHIYKQSGEYTCSLTVTDNAKEITTSVSILAKINNPPQVVVLVNLPNSNRPFIPGLGAIGFLPFVGDKLLIVLASNATSSLFSKKSWIKCDGQVFDPDGDEIVSYKWELQQPATTFLGTQSWPKSYFEGKDLKNITIPTLYTFRTGDYTIKLTVTDSAGNSASDSKPFKISVSNVESFKYTIKNSWKTFWETKFPYKSESTQDLISKIMWVILGPIQNLSDRTMNKFLPLIPEKIRPLVESLYNTLWEQIEKTYRKPNNPPNAPSNPSPVDNSTGVDLNADLGWSCSDPDGHSMTYDVYFGTTSTPPLVFSGYGDTNFSLGELTSGTTYYWKIVAKDKPPTGDAKTTSSPIWKFTTV